MNTPTETELAWAAGFIDGEGCIHVRVSMPTETSRQRSPHYALALQVSNTNRQAIDRIHQMFGFGSVRSHHRENPKWTTAYVWYCMSKNAGTVLRLIQPYVFAKKAELEVGLEFDALPSGRKGVNRIDPELLRKRAELCDKLRSLKVGFKYRKHRWEGSAVLGVTEAKASANKSNLFGAGENKI